MATPSPLSCKAYPEDGAVRVGISDNTSKELNPLLEVKFERKMRNGAKKNMESEASARHVLDVPDSTQGVALLLLRFTEHDASYQTFMKNKTPQFLRRANEGIKMQRNIEKKSILNCKSTWICLNCRSASSQSSYGRTRA